HLVDASVAADAADTFVDVHAVIEVNELGQVVNAVPLQRLAGFEAVAHRFERRAVGPDLRMAVHARLSRRNPCESRAFDRSVAVAAVDADGADMVIVAERHWLLNDDVAPRRV